MFKFRLFTLNSEKFLIIAGMALSSVSVEAMRLGEEVGCDYDVPCSSLHKAPRSPLCKVPRPYLYKIHSPERDSDSAYSSSASTASDKEEDHDYEEISDDYSSCSSTSFKNPLLDPKDDDDGYLKPSTSAEVEDDYTKIPPLAWLEFGSELHRILQEKGFSKEPKECSKKSKAIEPPYGHYHVQWLAECGDKKAIKRHLEHLKKLDEDNKCLFSFLRKNKDSRRRKFIEKGVERACSIEEKLRDSYVIKEMVQESGEWARELQQKSYETGENGYRKNKKKAQKLLEEGVGKEKPWALQKVILFGKDLEQKKSCALKLAKKTDGLSVQDLKDLEYKIIAAIGRPFFENQYLPILCDSLEDEESAVLVYLLTQKYDGLERFAQKLKEKENERLQEIGKCILSLPEFS